MFPCFLVILVLANSKITNGEGDAHLPEPDGAAPAHGPDDGGAQGHHTGQPATLHINQASEREGWGTID